MKFRPKIYGNWIVALFLIYSNKINAQDWQQIGHFFENDNTVYELFTDSTENLLYFGGKVDSIEYMLTNIAVYNGKQIKSLKVDINDCWNLGCTGVFTIGKYKDEIYASIVRSTDDSNQTLTGIGRWNGQQWNSVGAGVKDYPDKPWPSAIMDFQVWNDTLFIAGWLNYVDDKPASAVAAWDGEHWMTFGYPNTFANSVPLANAVSVYKSKIYVGGNLFFEKDGQTYYDLVVFDGQTWMPLGTGIHGQSSILDLEVFNGKLYVAGTFSQSSGNAGNNIMTWDGEYWDDLGGGAIANNGYAWVTKMVVDKGKLYVVGKFDEIGGIPAKNIAVWDGKNWCAIGHSEFDFPPVGIAVFQDTVFVGGGFDTIDNQVIRRFAKFTATPASQLCANVATSYLENQKEELTITPTPANQTIQITIPAGAKPIEMQVFNVLGQMVYQAQRKPLSDSVITLDIGHWMSGLYFVEVRAGDGRMWNGRFLRG